MYILFEVMGDLPLHVLFWVWHPESFSRVSYVALLQILLDDLPVDPQVDHQDPRAASILDPRASILDPRAASILDPRASILDPRAASILDPRASILDPRAASILDPRAASILDPRASIQNRMRRQKERKTLTSILKSRR